jgi:hypothetical protein
MGEATNCSTASPTTAGPAGATAPAAGTPEGYVSVLSALRGERVRPEPFAAVEWLVGVPSGYWLAMHHLSAPLISSRCF